MSQDPSLDALKALSPGVTQYTEASYRYVYLPKLKIQIGDDTRELDALLERIDAVDDLQLAVDEQVDLEVLRARLAAEAFDLSEIGRHRWDPLAWDPAGGLHALAIEPAAPGEATRW